MLTVIVHSKHRYDSTPLFLDLPASYYDLLDTQARLGSGAPSPQLLEYESDVPRLAQALYQMKPTETHLLELNHLATQLEDPNFCAYLQALLAIHEDCSLRELIQLSSGTNEIIVAGDIHNTHDLGKFLVEHDFVQLPEDVLPYIDYSKIGQAHLDNTPAVIQNGIYYEDHRTGTQAEDLILSVPERSQHIFIAEIFDAALDAEDALHVKIGLPASEETIREAMLDIGADSVRVCNFQSAVNRFHPMFDQPYDLNLLNALAHKIHGMDDSEFIKFLAVQEYTQSHEAQQNFNPDQSLQDTLALIARLDCYEFEPNVSELELVPHGRVFRHIEPQMEQIAEVEPELDAPSFEMGGM